MRSFCSIYKSTVQRDNPSVAIATLRDSSLYTREPFLKFFCYVTASFAGGAFLKFFLCGSSLCRGTTIFPSLPCARGGGFCKAKPGGIVVCTVDLQIIQNDSITIPQSPLCGASSLCTREPFDLFRFATVHFVRESLLIYMLL